MDRARTLVALCGSQARYRLLRELYRDPGAEHGLRGWAAAAGVDPGHAHKLARQFVQAALCEQVAGTPFPRYRASREPSLQQALVALFGAQAPTDPMREAAERSLRLHQAAVERLRRDPRALQRVRATLERWIARYGADVPHALLEWAEILRKPVAEIAESALQKTQYGERIRKSSPLSTLVPGDERRKIYAAR